MQQVSLPSPHVPRPRLVRRLEDAPVGIVVAGGGFGKSVLAAELRSHLGIAAAEISLDRDTSTAEELLGAVRRGLRRGGLSDSAAALTGTTAEDVREALGHGPPGTLLAFDEVQHATGPAAALLAELAARPAGGRLLLIGRRLRDELEAFAGSGARLAVRLGEDDLAFDDAELAALLARVGTGDPAAEEVAGVRRLTFGWPAASALAAAAIARGGSLARAPAGRSPLGGLVDDLLAGLEAGDRERVARLGHLPLLIEEVADAAAGPGALPLLREAGIPARPAGDGWLQLADPVREELSRRAALPPEAARDAAAAYAAAGELPVALNLLGRAGEGSAIAALLAATRWQELAALDLAELRAILSTLPEAAIEAHPFATGEFDEDAYGVATMRIIRAFVGANTSIGEEEAEAWEAEQVELGERGEFFFGCTQFCFSARRPE